MVTIEDVALEVGCSVNTVSRAINNKPDVSPLTRAKVLEAAKRLGYVPNTLAKSLVTRSSGTIGTVLPDLTNPVYSALAGAIELAGMGNGYVSYFVQTKGDGRAEQELLETLYQKRIDGLIIVPTGENAETLRRLASFGLPIVTALNHAEDVAAFIGFAVEDMFYTATAHLLGRGRRSVCFLSTFHINPLAKLCLNGYKKALAEYDVPMQPGFMIDTTATINGGYTATLSLLKRLEKVDGIVTDHDMVVPGIFAALRDAGLSCPRDVGLVSCGDTELCSYMPVPVTSFPLDIVSVGNEAVDALCNLMNRAGESRSVIKRPTLTIRRSSQTCTDEEAKPGPTGSAVECY